jgi:hypothetical protein
MRVPFFVCVILWLTSVALFLLGVVWWRESGAGWGAPLAWLVAVWLDNVVREHEVVSRGLRRLRGR